MNIEYIQEDNVLYPDEDRGYELIPFFSKKRVRDLSQIEGYPSQDALKRCYFWYSDDIFGF